MKVERDENRGEFTIRFGARTWESGWEAVEKIRAEAAGYGFKVVLAKFSQRKPTGKRINVAAVMAELGLRRNYPSEEEMGRWLEKIVLAAVNARP